MKEMKTRIERKQWKLELNESNENLDWTKATKTRIEQKQWKLELKESNEN